MKTLLLNVSCVNSEFDEAPEHLVVELSSSQMDYIKSMCEQVRLLDVYCIEWFDGSGVYLSSMAIEDLIEETNIEVDSIDEAAALSANDPSGRIDSRTIIALKEGFKFSGVPKHCGEAEQCYSALISLKELDRLDTYCAIAL